MLSQSDIDKLCVRELSKLNLGSACDHFISALESGNTRKASLELQEIILYSVSRCLHKVLEESKRY